MVQLERELKITVHVQQRRDGGLRVWSDDVPGLVLSHRDPERVWADIAPALQTILSEKYGCAVEVSPLTAFPVAVRSARLVRKAPPLRRFFNIFDKVQFAASPCLA